MPATKISFGKKRIIIPTVKDIAGLLRSASGRDIKRYRISCKICPKWYNEINKRKRDAHCILGDKVWKINFHT